MITAIAQNIADYLMRKSVIDSKKLDIHIYGLEILISNALTFLIAIALGILFNQILLSLVSLTVLACLRTQVGGYHADTYLKCNLTFATVSVLVMLAAKFIDFYNMSFHFAICILSIIIIAIVAPVENKFKPIKLENRKKHKLKALILTFVFMMLSTMFFKASIKLSITVDLTLLIVSLFAVFEILRKGGRTDEKGTIKSRC